MGSDTNSILKLKTLVNYVVLCRDKATIKLPDRSDEIHHLEFTTNERRVYNEAKARTSSLLDGAIATRYAQKSAYLNALQWLNDLRLICNHGMLHANRDTLPSMKTHDDLGNWTASAAQDAFNSMVGGGAATCVGCSKSLADNILEIDNTELPNPLLTECLFLLCGQCRVRSVRSLSTHKICSHIPTCGVQEVTHFELCSVTMNNSSSYAEMKDVPTKVKALLAGLQSRHDNEKRLVSSSSIVRHLLIWLQ